MKIMNPKMMIKCFPKLLMKPSFILELNKNKFQGKTY